MPLLSAAFAHPAAAALAAGAACAYGALAGWHTRVTQPQARAILSAAWVLHLLVLITSLLTHPVRFGFGPAISITAWLLLTVYLVESRLYPQMRARWVLAVMGMAAVLVALVFPGSHYPQLPSHWMPLHWALGIAAYGLIAAAVVHAWLMQRAEKAMRLGKMPETAMPILTLERLTFRFVGAGFVLLSATLLAGAWFSEMINQQVVWNHKTAFSVLSWASMGVLLLGRWRLGWRGRTAVRMLYISAGFLLLSYVGSRFVLEVVLQRA
ncbi:cytochrome C assembly protein [Hydrogenophaga crassostreae]|uniref:Cytochrome C assembly protein n=1 Tax=Hydrogenophaga crassostreae TaxID=1763535 RepID=A0A170AHF8_9BURK|nr:cytochrome c biogenesis protein CcsA [Hydrogenophaga crassostreae]AOW15317.1 cytochrome C assembly protein [Hydrogenophaga crassostreae]OAD43938.1 cytochrome C assembly protein [Hydrogenophaga crassostreae]